MPGIIVGIDGSDNAQNALEWAMTEAAARRAPLTVLTVHPEAIGAWGLRPISYPADQEEQARARQAAEEAVEKIISNLPVDSRPKTVTVRAASGIVAEELINASAGADLLVLGSRGHGGFARLMIGSVSTQVSHHALCPVVIVPAERRR
jgi:nucleotide-binding universal stress UspA family protein